MQKDTYKLISGGVDSYIMARMFPGQNIFINFGQPYWKEELAAINKQGLPVCVVNISGDYSLSDGIFIPNRNLAMAALVSMLHNAKTIMIAGLRDDNCADKTSQEFERMSEILSRYAEHRVEVISPFWSKSKGEIVYDYIKAFGKDGLQDTFSCYHPDTNGNPCGDCPACLRRTVALETNGVNSGVTLTERIIREYLKKIHLYDIDRQSRLLLYLQRKGGIEAVDIDGVLAEDFGDYADRKFLGQPRRKYKYRILYTARLEADRMVTENWLARHNIKYDALLMNKAPYDILIDDRAITK